MVVVEFIVNFSTHAVVFDDFSIAQDGKLVGDGGFGHIEDVGDVADAHFTLVERPKDLDTGGMTEDFEELGKTV